MANEFLQSPGYVEGDSTTAHIYEVIRTLGGSTLDGLEGPAFHIEFPNPRMMRPGTYQNLLAMGAKIEMISRVVQGRELPEGDAADQIRERVAALQEAPGSPAMAEAVAGGRVYLHGEGQPDRFDLRGHGAALAEASRNGVMRLDLVDLAVALRASTQVNTPLLANDDGARRARASERFPDLERAYLTELIDTLDVGQLFGEQTINLQQLYAHVHGVDPRSIGPDERERIRLAQALIRERLTISDLVMEGGLWTTSDRDGGSAYARRRSEGELAQLNDHAADAIERLHLLTAYDVTPYEVPAESLQLPWDVAVVPALETGPDGAPRYADGAVADFLFQTPNQGGAAGQQSPEAAALLAGTQTRLRLRLHDNGQVSHGFSPHNVPGDSTERAFMQDMSAIAFQQIRGLLISLAFDAIAPNSVVRGRTVGGSAATILTQGVNLGDRLTGLLQRRSRALQQAGVGEGSLTPEGWEPPRRQVGGYRRRLPAGSRPRPTAEEEARAYFESIGEQFDGLPEGYTFVRPYARRDPRYRRANFRP
jgi:hypothetical protein